MQSRRLAGAEAVRALLGAPADPETEPDWLSCRREGLLGLAASHRMRSGLTLPADVRLQFIQAIAFELQCAQVLEELSRLADSRSIPLLTFKGAALAFGLYPQAGQRGFGDIDIAIPSHRLQEFRDLLEQQGFVGDDVIFCREGQVLDLHTHPLHQLVELVGPFAQEWWSSCVPLSSRTGSTLRLAHEYEFVLALFHGAKHSFSRAGWVVDIGLLAQRVQASRLADFVRRFRVQSQFAYAQECLKEWFDYDIGEQINPKRRPNFLERRFLKMVLERRAPDYLGMLTPIPSAQSKQVALKFLWESLYPKGIPCKQRTRQLLRMLRSVL